MNDSVIPFVLQSIDPEAQAQAQKEAQEEAAREEQVMIEATVNMSPDEIMTLLESRLDMCDIVMDGYTSARSPSASESIMASFMLDFARSIRMSLWWIEHRHGEKSEDTSGITQTDKTPSQDEEL